MDKTGWKVLAVVMLCIVIVESAIIFWIFGLGFQVLEDEKECAYNICEGVESVYYLYDDDTRVCTCYDQDYNVLRKELIE